MFVLINSVIQCSIMFVVDFPMIQCDLFLIIIFQWWYVWFRSFSDLVCVVFVLDLPTVHGQVELLWLGEPDGVGHIHQRPTTGHRL